MTANDRIRDAFHLSPIMRRHLAATRIPTREEETAALVAIAGARLSAWAAVLSDPARSQEALRRGCAGAGVDLAARLDGTLPGLMWSQACDEAARSRPRSPARDRMPAAALLFARELVRVDATDDCLRAVVGALDKGPAAPRARAALATLDARVRDLVDHNLRLVASVAHGAMRSRGDGSHNGSEALTTDDLMGHGAAGLERGIRGYDPSHDTRLSTYVVPWIRAHIQRALQDLSRVIRLPTHLLETMGKVHRVAREYGRSLGREATPAEIAAAIGKPLATIERVLDGSIPGVTSSLDAPAPASVRGGGIAGDGESPVARLASPDMSPEDALAASESRDVASRRLGELLGVLTDRERDVVERRFGLVALGAEDDAEDEITLKAIGESMAISRQRTQQIYANAMRKMRVAAARSC